MRRLALIVVAVSVALVGGSAAEAAMDHGGHGGGVQGAGVSMQYAAFAPVHVDALAGDEVMWTNASARVHTVNGDDGSFDSDRIAVGGTYAHSFGAAGTYAYHCRLHPTMRGEVDVHTLLLDAQPESAAPGRSYPLPGRAALPAGTEVSIEGDSGSGFERVGSATVGVDGGFSGTVTPAASTTYRAVHGGEASPPVELLVLDRHVRARAARHGRAVVVSAAVTPASHGQIAVLQLRLRERFGWWPVRRARLDHRSRVRFAIHTRRRVTARVVLTRADAATELARSAVLRLPSGAGESNRM
jgi:plastocyanin